MSTNTSYLTIRRVVTGYGANRRSKVFWDGVRTSTRQLEPSSVTASIWSSSQIPADISIGENIEDMGDSYEGARGTRFRIVDFKPGMDGIKHRTDTLDYVIVISGEIDLDLDDSTVKLKAGDVVVQRGTNHAWSNRGTLPARLAFVLIDATGLGIGKPITLGDKIEK